MEECDTRNVFKDMGSDSRNGHKNRKSGIIITSYLTATKSRSNHPWLATWKPQPIQETIQPLAKLAAVKGWGGGGGGGGGGQLMGSKTICAQAREQAHNVSPKVRLMKGFEGQTQ